MYPNFRITEHLLVLAWRVQHVRPNCETPLPTVLVARSGQAKGAKPAVTLQVTATSVVPSHEGLSSSPPLSWPGACKPLKVYHSCCLPVQWTRNTEVWEQRRTVNFCYFMWTPVLNTHFSAVGSHFACGAVFLTSPPYQILLHEASKCIPPWDPWKMT